MPDMTRANRWRRRAMIYGSVYTVALVVMAFGGCADRLILIPQTAELRSVGSERRALPFEGGDLEIWIAPPDPRHDRTRGFVLVFNGNADRAESAVVAEAYFWRDQPVEVWAVNYPGYGGSSGPARLARLAPAGLTAYDELHRHAAGRPIFISGNSLGTTVALHIAAHRDADGLVLRNPPPLRQLIVGRFGWWNLWLLAGPISLGVPQDLDSLANARAAAAPAVFVLADTDEIVPPSYQRMVRDAYAGPARTLDTAGGHNTPLTPAADQTLRQHLQWLWTIRDETN